MSQKIPILPPAQSLYLDTIEHLDYGRLTNLLQQKHFEPSPITHSGDPYWEREREEEGIALRDRIVWGHFEYGYDDLLRWPKSCSYKATVTTNWNDGSLIAKVSPGVYDIEALRRYMSNQLHALGEELSDIFTVRERDF